MTGYEANTSRPRSPLRPRVRSPVYGRDFSYGSSSGDRLRSLIRRDSLTGLYTKWISDGPAPGLTNSPWPYESNDISSYIPSAREAPARYSSTYTSSAASPYSSLSTYTPTSTTSPYSSLSTYTPTATTCPYSSLSTYTPTSTTSPYSSLSTYTPTSTASPYSSLSAYTPSYSRASTYGGTSSAETGPTWSEYYASRSSGAGGLTRSSSSKGKGVDYGRGKY